jgi:hypothetical protein
VPVLPPPNATTIGGTLTVHDLYNNPVQITVSSITDPAVGANQFDTPDPGDRFVAVQERLADGSAATVTDDANSDTAIIGTDGQTYVPDFDDVKGCTNFGYGDFTLSVAAPVSVGCVVFQLPTTVGVRQVQFGLGIGVGELAYFNVP